MKTVGDRIARAETGAGRLYGVTTHHSDPRVVVVGIGRVSAVDAERAHNLDIASVDWSDRDRAYAPRGPQGPSVRTLVALALSLAS